MSKKDRERYKLTGIVFRNGKFVSAEDVSGTKENKAKQARVDAAIAAIKDGK
jgi:hypothetical protein